MKTQEPMLAVVVMGAAGALAWLLGRRAASGDAAAAAAGRPVLQLPATGDGTTLASVAETREALDVLFDNAHCADLPRAGQRRRCRRKLSRKKNKAIKRGAKHVVNVDPAAIAMQSLGAIGSLVQQTGGAVAQVYGAQTPATTPATVK